MTIKEKKIAISKELSQYITPLSAEEFGILEESIVQEGCKDALVVWSKGDGQTILVDGHNRFKICQKHAVPFIVKVKTFASIDQVKVWMLDNQMGRRNLTPDQLSYFRGLRYLALRKPRGGYENVKAKGGSEGVTSEVLSEKFNVSESTVKRDAKFAEGLNIIGRSNPKLKSQILSGDVKVKKADIQILPDSKKADDLAIRNEADLYNKAKRIREDLLNEIEAKVKSIGEKRVASAQKILAEKEPVFLKKEDRFRKIKGMVISAINRAINKRDVKAIKELKDLIDELENVIFD